jgi:hypothetical protein
MKTFGRILTVCILLIICQSGKAQKTYRLISPKTGKINKELLPTLPPALKALAAFYSAMGGTNCMDLNCELTNALGLGKQGSDEQKKIIEKYFPDDKAAKLVLGQDCYLPPSTSSSFSNFKSLAFVVSGENVWVNYQLAVYERGNIKIINGPDIYILRNQVFKNQKRVLYAWTGK